MSNLRLKSANGFAPSGMAYTDPRTGRQFDGYERSVDGAIQMIIEHRRRNPKAYPESEGQWFEFTSVKQEFLRHIFTKNPSLFKGNSEMVNPPQKQNVPAKCSCGGTIFSPTYCPTCAGQRINGYKCDGCGKIFGI